MHKIVFDPRYLLLTSKERKQVKRIRYAIANKCHIIEDWGKDPKALQNILIDEIMNIL